MSVAPISALKPSQLWFEGEVMDGIKNVLDFIEKLFCLGMPSS
jgi:hypothetical protein